MTPFEKTVLAIIKSGLYGGPAGPLPGRQAEPNTKQNAPQNTAPGLVLDSAFNWQQLLKIGQQHQITPLLYYGLVRAKIKPPSAVEASLYKVTVSAVLITQNQQHALKAVCRAFEQNGICYLPLKGAVLQQLYAKPEQRLMSDADLLIKPEQYKKIKTILIGLSLIHI